MLGAATLGGVATGLRVAAGPLRLTRELPEEKKTALVEFLAQLKGEPEGGGDTEAGAGGEGGGP